MRSMDKMLFMVYSGHKNPERTKTGVFISERRQIKFAEIKAREAAQKALDQAAIDEELSGK